MSRDFKLVMLNGIGPSSVEWRPLAPERMMSRGTLEPGAVIFTVPAYSILAFSRASALETETIVSCEPYTLNNQLYTSSALVSTYSLDSQTGIAVPSHMSFIAEPGYCSTEGCMDSNFLEFDLLQWRTMVPVKPQLSWAVCTTKRPTLIQRPTLTMALVR